MNAQQDLVNILAKRKEFTDTCMKCGKEVFFHEKAYVQYRYGTSVGACIILYCDECIEEYMKTHKSVERISPKILPLP